MRQALVVDDSKAIRMILGKQLANLGYEVSQAANGKEALQVAQTLSSLSLAMVDWNMPVMNGLDFVKALRADSQFGSVTVVMVTTETEFERVTAALEAGANDYIMKPFTDDVISEKLLLLGM